MPPAHFESIGLVFHGAILGTAEFGVEQGSTILEVCSLLTMPAGP